MATYEDDHNITPPTTTQPLPSTSNPANPATHPDPDAPPPSRYAARPAPRTLEEFLEMVQGIQDDPESGGLAVDEDLFEEVFGGRGVWGGASAEFVKNLHKVDQKELDRLGENPYQQSCPICSLTYAEILTEQEYAESTDHYVPGGVDDLGLRRLPCGQLDSPGQASATQGGEVKGSEGGGVKIGSVGHVVCAKCAGKWLKLQNTCPMCRSRLDPSVPATEQNPDPFNPNVQAQGPDLNNPLVELFRRVFGNARENEFRADFGGGQEGEAAAGLEGMSGFLGGEMFFGGMEGGRRGRNGEREREEDREEFSGMYS